jgi:hypothetical protein
MLYRPVNIDAWRDEIENLEEQLSSEFLDALAQLDYELTSEVFTNLLSWRGFRVSNSTQYFITRPQILRAT